MLDQIGQKDDIRLLVDMHVYGFTAITVQHKIAATSYRWMVIIYGKLFEKTRFLLSCLLQKKIYFLAETKLFVSIVVYCHLVLQV